MSPAIKYAFGRLGLFLVCAILALGLLPRDMNGFLKLLIAMVASLPLSYLLLRKWRDQVAEQFAAGQERRIEQKQRLRAALAGEDEAEDERTPRRS
jgi:hypothetical protein